MPEPEVRILSPADTAHRAAWNAFVRARAESCGYHRMEWLAIINEAFGHPVFPLALHKNGQIRGVLPLALVASRLFGRFLVSLPFVNYGGVLAEDAPGREALLDTAKLLMSRLGAESVELRHRERSLPDLPAQQHKVSMLLPLAPEPETLWNGFKDKVRNQVRKALKNGLTATEGGLELLDEFYAVFCVNMRALGTPVYSSRFFHTVLRRLPEETRVIAVRQKGRCLAAGILYTPGGTAEMPWASSLPEFRHLCPNNMLYWEAISRSCSRGCACFDFGRSTPDSGPWRFKRQWGAEALPLHWEYLLSQGKAVPALNPQNPKFKMAVRLWKLLPLAVANTLGPRIVRCIP